MSNNYNFIAYNAFQALNSIEPATLRAVFLQHAKMIGVYDINGPDHGFQIYLMQDDSVIIRNTHNNTKITIESPDCDFYNLAAFIASELVALKPRIMQCNPPYGPVYRTM